MKLYEVKRQRSLGAVTRQEEKMRIPLLLLTFSLSMGPAWSQAPASSNITPHGELFRLATSSDFIAIGTVTSSRAISKRLTEKELLNLDDVGKTLGGVLYTFHAEQVICARADFKSDTQRPRITSDKFLIFKKRDTRFFQEESYKEKILYLILLTALPEQEQLSRAYRLEKGQTYYEAFEGKKGLVPVADDKRPLLIKLKQFCDAVRPPSAIDKLKGLSRLTHARDPDLRQSAKEAIRLIKENNRR